MVVDDAVISSLKKAIRESLVVHKYAEDTGYKFGHPYPIYRNPTIRELQETDFENPYDKYKTEMIELEMLA